jgi:hypothetical protein
MPAAACITCLQGDCAENTEVRTGSDPGARLAPSDVLPPCASVRRPHYGGYGVSERAQLGGSIQKFPLAIHPGTVPRRLPLPEGLPLPGWSLDSSVVPRVSGARGLNVRCMCKMNSRSAFGALVQRLQSTISICLQSGPFLFGVLIARVVCHCTCSGRSAIGMLRSRTFC